MESRAILTVILSKINNPDLWFKWLFYIHRGKLGDSLLNIVYISNLVT